MKKTFIACLVIAVCFYCCKPSPGKEPGISFRDSMLRSYIAIADSIPWHGNDNIDYKLLRAYFRNDSAELREIQQYMQPLDPWTKHMDTCSIHGHLHKINAEEVYRFTYHMAFCPYNTNQTIIRYEDSIVLETIVYHYENKDMPCKVDRQYLTRIDSVGWKNFAALLRVSDFWSLKSHNDYLGLDGSDLTVYGFVKHHRFNRSPKINLVARWAPENYPIIDCYNLLRKYSKLDTICPPLRNL